MSAARAWHGLAIQRGRDDARRLAGEIVREDPEHSRRFAADDLEDACLPGHRAIAERTAAVVPAVAQHAGLPAPHLAGEVLKVERAEQAFDADVQRAGDTIVRSQDMDAEKFQAPVHVRQVGLVAREAIECLGDHDREAAGLRIAHQPLKAHPVDDRGSGERVILVDADDLYAFARRDGAAERDLVDDRPSVLLIG